jgi:hypothetical protein
VSHRPAVRLAVKRIVVIGYPKSGCTWATRLVAELVGCPVAGFWQSDKKEIAVEGQDRISDYRCYKADHTLPALRISPNEPKTWLIYILRDPRDIAISGASHFQFDRYPVVTRLFRALPQGNKLFRHTVHPLFVRQTYRMKRMTEALLRGDVTVHRTVGISWRDHWRPYLEAGVPIIRYEDLLATPETECSRILCHLGLERSQEEISNAIRNQSFARKKESLLERGETGQAKFLRVGKSGQWRVELPPDLQRRFADELTTELARWGYST